MSSKGSSTKDHVNGAHTMHKILSLVRAPTHDIPLKTFPKDYRPGGVREGFSGDNKLYINWQEAIKKNLKAHLCQFSGENTIYLLHRTLWGTHRTYLSIVCKS